MEQQDSQADTRLARTDLVVIRVRLVEVFVDKTINCTGRKLI